MPSFVDLEIHDWAVSDNGSIAIGVDKVSIAHVIDIEHGRICSAFPVIWDNGGRRIAVNSKGDCCISGAYGKGGVAGYDIRSGTRRWHQPDIRHVQAIRFDEHDGLCTVANEDSCVSVIDPLTGESQGKTLRARAVWPCGNRPLWLAGNHDLRLLERDTIAVRWTGAKRSFAVLTAAFADTLVFVSESGGPMRALDLRDGSTLWELQFDDAHYLEVAWCPRERALYGIRWEYKSGAYTCLDKVEPQTGVMLRSISLGPVGTGGRFIRDGTAIFMYTGRILDNESAQELLVIR